MKPMLPKYQICHIFLGLPSHHYVRNEYLLWSHSLWSHSSNLRWHSSLESVKTQAEDTDKWVKKNKCMMKSGGVTGIRKTLCLHMRLHLKKPKPTNHTQTTKTINSNTGLVVVLLLERLLSWCEMKKHSMGRRTKRFSVFLKSDETKRKVKERKFPETKTGDLLTIHTKY